MSYEHYKQKLVAFYEKHGRFPGYKEIMAFTGFRSKNAVFKLIERLQFQLLIEHFDFLRPDARYL